MADTTPSTATTEASRFSIRLPRSLWIGLALAVITVPAALGRDPEDDNADASPQELQVNISQLNVAFEKRLAVAMQDAKAARMQFDAGLRQRIALVDRVCRLTDAQRQKLELASLGDTKRLSDRVTEIDQIRVNWSIVKDDPEKVSTLLSRESQTLARRLLQATIIDDSLSIKALEHLLTDEQRVKYQPFRAVFRAGGHVQTPPRGSDDVHEIILRGSELPKVGLAILREFHNLQFLHLDGTRGTDAGLAQLGELTDLRRLQLHSSSVTDAGLLNVKGMTKLEWLSLDNTLVTDAGVAELEEFTKLKCLSLSNTQVTDIGLSHVKCMTSLQRLQLRNTSVTDVGLAQLEVLSELKFLGLAKTQVSDAGVAQLKHVIPGLNVER